MDVAGAMHWWQEWQMRILALASLTVYFGLYFGNLLRMSPRLRKLRPLVWLAYVSGDALAIYALATLFNRQRLRSTCSSRGSSDLEVLWAPVLLIHLGGQTTMTAYSLEDNELWMRHAMTLVSQVLIALYVFYNWWSGDRQLLNVAVLLFVVGIIKSSCKPWALKRASFTSMLASSAAFAMKRKMRKRGGIVAACCSFCTTYLWEHVYFTESPSEELVTSPPELVEVQHTEKEDEFDRRRFEVGDLSRMNSELVNLTALGDFVSRARRLVISMNEGIRGRFMYVPFRFIYKMFVSLPQPYPDRLKDLESLHDLGDGAIYDSLRQWLYNIFRILYTRHRVNFTCLGAFLQLSLPLLTLTSVVLFAKSHKGGYDVNDVWVTYVFFSFTALHEFLPFLPTALFRGRHCHRRPTWPETVWQCSLMSFCARKVKFHNLIQLPYFKDYWHVEHKPDARIITYRVLKHVKEGWKEYICGPISYRGFNNLRGQWTLEEHKGKLKIEEDNNDNVWNVLEDSLMVPFDQSVLIWHVATEICYYRSEDSDGRSTSVAIHKETQDLAGVISKYMAYLLFIHPEMLIPGGRSVLFNIASDQITDVLKLKDKEGDGIPGEPKGIALKIAEWPESETPALLEPNEIDLIRPAKKLYEALNRLDQDKWKVIEGVWVEMLCYSAARCSGYLHARSLGHGGEFLSYLWLLWSFMGMETLADKITMMEPPTKEEREKVDEQEEEEKARNQGRQQKRSDSQASSSQQGHDIAVKIS